MFPGGEALYADMGHFGLRPIRHAWYFFVLPCLVLNYLGQGALVLNHPEALKNPFFEAVPSWALYPMIILATMAAVIASQSVITGSDCVVDVYGWHEFFTWFALIVGTRCP